MAKNLLEYCRTPKKGQTKNERTHTMNNANTNTNTATHYEPALCFYHANAHGTGCALKITLHPAHESIDGCIQIKFANQVTEGFCPRFDWDNAIDIKLGFIEVASVLQVLRDEVESIADGRGIFIHSPHYSARFAMRHMIEPTACYSIEAYRHDKATAKDTAYNIIISYAEALGLCLALEQVMAVLAFGRFN